MKRVLSVFLILIIIAGGCHAVYADEVSEAMETVRDFSLNYLAFLYDKYQSNPAIFDADNTELMYRYFKLFSAAKDICSKYSLMQSQNNLLSAMAKSLESANITMQSNADEKWALYISHEISRADFLAFLSEYVQACIVSYGSN